MNCVNCKFFRAHGDSTGSCHIRLPVMRDQEIKARRVDWPNTSGCDLGQPNAESRET